MTAMGGSKTWAGSGRAALGRAEAAMSSSSPQGPAATKAGGTKLAGFGAGQVGQDPGLVADERRR